LTITAPVLPNGKQVRERICLFGPPKVGKTHQFFTIAKWHQDMGSDARFYALSSDTSYDVLAMNDDFANLTNMEWVDVSTFQDYLDGARKFNSQMRSHDWLSVDLMSDAWPAAQDEYARVLTRESGANLDDIGDLWATSGKSDDYPITGWQWGMPNARYRILANNLILRCPGHTLLVYGQRDMMKESGSGKTGENSRTREMFGHLGVKPMGQKEDPFRYHTFLHVDSAGDKAQRMATAGERWGYRAWLGKRMGNGSMMDQPIDDFFLDYLVGIAKWTI
jgi:hypothetical protein